MAALCPTLAHSFFSRARSFGRGRHREPKAKQSRAARSEQAAPGLLRLRLRNDGMDGPFATASKCQKVVV
jgi:hypothetical protein